MASLSLSSPKKHLSLNVATRKYKKNRRNVQNAGDTLPLARCDEDASLFTVSVTIGSQPFQLVVDTASTDMWITAQGCDDCMETPNRYDVTDATPLYDNVLENVYESVSAGSQLNGRLYQDQIIFADTIQIPEQAFAVIDRMQSFYDPPCENQWDGFLGLGPLNQGLTGEGQVEHFDTVVKHLHDALPRPIFALHLTDDDLSSQLLLGGIDRSVYLGCLVWHDVQPMELDVDILWNLKVQSSSVGDVGLPDVDSAVLDSSAAFSLGPSYAVAAFLEQSEGWFCGARDEFTGVIQNVSCGAAFFEFGFGPCDAPVDALVVRVDDVAYSMTKMTTPLSEDDAVGIDSDVDKWCLLTLLPDGNLAGWLLGQQFFKDYFVAFDIQENKIGLAQTRSAEDVSSPLCSKDELLDIHNSIPASSSSAPTLAPSDGAQFNANSQSPAPSPPDNQESSVPPAAFESDFPTKAPAPGDSAIASLVPITTKAPSREPTVAPHRFVVPPHSSPHSPTPSPYTSSDSSENVATIVPFVVGAAFLGLLVLCAMKRRRGQGRYRRAGWSDGYTMGGDLELRDFS